MGLRDLFSKKMLDCNIKEDGTKVCRVAVHTKKGNFFTGSERSHAITQDCEPVIVGRSRMVEGDEELLDKAIQEDVNACRRGLKEG